MRKTHALIQVLAAIMESPDDRYWGYDLWKRSGVRSGVMYPILHRLLDEGWLVDGWEDQPPTERKRPPRRYYELTDMGRKQIPGLLREVESDAGLRHCAG